MKRHYNPGKKWHCITGHHLQKQEGYVEIRVNGNRNIEQSLKKLRKKLERENLFQELRDRMFFVPKSARKKKAKKSSK